MKLTSSKTTIFLRNFIFFYCLLFWFRMHRFTIHQKAWFVDIIVADAESFSSCNIRFILSFQRNFILSSIIFFKRRLNMLWNPRISHYFWQAFRSIKSGRYPWKILIGNVGINIRLFPIFNRFIFDLLLRQYFFVSVESNITIYLRIVDRISVIYCLLFFYLLFLLIIKMIATLLFCQDSSNTLFFTLTWFFIRKILIFLFKAKPYIIHLKHYIIKLSIF